MSLLDDFGVHLVPKAVTTDALQDIKEELFYRFADSMVSNPSFP
jgi:hypothetical protein